MSMHYSDEQYKPRRLFRMIIPAYPAFNIYSGVAGKMTAMGPVCVATALRETSDWDTEIIDENNYRRGAPRGADGLPDHAGLQQLRHADAVGLYGGLTSTIPRLLQLASYYRSIGVTTVAGGQHFAEETTEEALRHGVDFVVHGEGEEVVKEILESVDGLRERRSVRGVDYIEDEVLVRTDARPQIQNLDALPVPDYSLLRYSNVEIYPVGRVRGCGMDCEFCSVKGKPRCASAEKLMAQFSSLYEKRGARNFFLVDDLFGQDRSETLHLCELLGNYQKKAGVRFKVMVQIRLDKAKDDELLSAMRAAGINRVAIGFESPIAEELEAMNKHLLPERMVKLARLYRRAGFSLHGMFIFGYPMRKGQHFQMGVKERVKRFRSFIRRARIDTLQVLLPVPLPGTELRQRLEAEGRIYAKELIGWEYYDGNFPLFEPDDPLTAQEMQGAVQTIMGRFYRGTRALSVGLDILTFPGILFHMHNVRAGWRRWCRRWFNNVVGFAGWRIMRRWRGQFRRSDFKRKLVEAQSLL